MALLGRLRSRRLDVYYNGFRYFHTYCVTSTQAVNDNVFSGMRQSMPIK